MSAVVKALVWFGIIVLFLAVLPELLIFATAVVLLVVLCVMTLNLWIWVGYGSEDSDD